MPDTATFRFLTDGVTWLGPYADTEIQAYTRGRNVLREAGGEVYAVRAADLPAAKRQWAATRTKK